jgi:hypothetical protein
MVTSGFLEFIKEVSAFARVCIIQQVPILLLQLKEELVYILRL